MAEEKKIENLEAMNKEELEQVAGGTYLESGSDAKKFKEIGVNLYDSSIFGVPIINDFNKLREAFNQYGVTIKDNGGIINANEYFIGDKKVSRDDAWKHIYEQLKK